MKKFWKTINGTCIYSSKNGMQVHENLIYRWLTFNSGFIQTLINKRHPHFPSLQYIKPITFALRNNPGNSCLFGLGGGGIAHYINKFQLKLTIIEKNAQIIQIAKEHFQINKLKDINIIQERAELFAQDTQNKYNNLLIDIHGSDSFPEECKNTNFFHNCHNLLQKDGFLCINIANNNDIFPILNFIKEQFHNKTICITIKNSVNMLILAQKSEQPTYFINQFTHNKEIKNIYWDKDFGCLARL